MNVRSGAGDVQAVSDVPSDHSHLHSHRYQHTIPLWIFGTAGTMHTL